MEIRISFDRLDKVSFRDLPPPRGKMKVGPGKQPYPVDTKLEFIEEISYQDLKKNRTSLVIDLVKKISWAVGYDHIGPDTIEELMKEWGRL